VAGSPVLGGSRTRSRRHEHSHFADGLGPKIRLDAAVRSEAGCNNNGDVPRRQEPADHGLDASTATSNTTSSGFPNKPTGAARVRAPQPLLLLPLRLVDPTPLLLEVLQDEYSLERDDGGVLARRKASRRCEPRRFASAGPSWKPWVADGSPKRHSRSRSAALAARDFADGVLLAANHSGGSDSTSAIAGNLLGVQLGERAIPHNGPERLELRDQIAQVAHDIHAAATDAPAQDSATSSFHKT
jgi:hypothetical protein